MDVQIGSLTIDCVSVGGRRSLTLRALSESISGSEGKDVFEDAFAAVFPGSEVVCIRELAASSGLTLGVEQLNTVVARAVATAAVRTVIDHDRDDDTVVRFPDTASFVAAFIHDHLQSRGDRWYFRPLNTYRLYDNSIDWRSLLTDHRALRWGIFAALERLGSLNRFLRMMRPGDLEAALSDVAESDRRSWETLVRYGAGESLSQLTSEAIQTAADQVASIQPPVDWTDIENVTAAAEFTRRSIMSAHEITAEPDHEDLPAALSGLSRSEHAQPGQDTRLVLGLDETVSPRTQEILASMERLASKALGLELRSETATSDLVRLVTALTQNDPRLEADDHVVSIARHVLARAITARSAPERHSSSDHVTRAAAALAQHRSTIDGPVHESHMSSLGASLLVLRSLSDLGLSSTALCRVPGSGLPLVTEVLRRVAGQTEQDRDPVCALLERLAPEKVVDVGHVQRTVVDRLDGQRAYGSTRHSLSALWRDRQVSVLHDELGRVVSLVEDTSNPDAAPPSARWQADISSAFAEMEVAHDPRTSAEDSLALDLLALSVLTAWARWLPGFSESSIPFLLSTFLRRPSQIGIDEHACAILLAPGSHDVVLDLAGYLKPFDAGPLLGGRRLTFALDTAR